MRRAPATLPAHAALIVATLAGAGCQLLGGAPPPPEPPRPAAGPAGASRVELRRAADRPTLSLVARLGDPASAMALAVAHDLGGEASVALAALLEARLRAAGFAEAAGAPHGLGLSVSVLVPEPGDAARFVEAAARVLRAPVGAGEPALGAVTRALRGLRARSQPGSAAAAVDACSGELDAAPDTPPLEPSSPRGVARLEAWRARVANASSVALAAVGAPAVLGAAADALSRDEPWPAGPAPDDPWPSRDQIGVDAAAGRAQRISVAFRLADPGVALEAARRLAAPSSELALRLGAFEPGWRLERAVGTARPRGACLRLDARASGAERVTTARAAAVIGVIEREAAEVARRTASAASNDWALDDSVLRPSDPREAAVGAAWRGLAAQRPAGPPRELVSFEAAAGPGGGAAASAALTQALDRERAAARAPVVERRVRVEAGQGELWALIASPCGTGRESSDDAGAGALVIRALARAAAAPGVVIEPWVTADGLGLLAHAARRDPEETPAEQARRVGGALGRALTALRLDGAEVVRARADLLDQLGAAANPGRSLVLESLAPDHPSWLEPRGTWRALSEAGADEARARRRQLVAEPLRLAVLASVDGAQADAVATALDGWVGPLRGPAETCPAATALTPRRGQLTVDSSVDDAGAATAWLAVSLGPDELPAARATAWLMNRPGGWLEQALRAPALASAARATVLGGARARALVLELTTAPAGAADAVAQVRGLFERLARGAATAADARLAAREEARVRAAEALDPRRRIVDLWRGASARGPLELGELHRFHARAFTADAPLVVTVKPRG